MKEVVRISSSLDPLAATPKQSAPGGSVAAEAVRWRELALVGGDGTVHAAANLAGPLPELALIPAGSANNIARGVGIPTDARAAAEVAVNGVARPLDLIEARTDDRRYLAVEGVSDGFLALARARYRSRNSADVSAALASGLAALARFRPVCVALERTTRPR